MSLATEIKTIRQKSFMTQTEFAAKINVTFNTVNRWETGKTRPNISAMKTIRTFCAENAIDSSNLEEAWIRSKVSDGGNDHG